MKPVFNKPKNFKKGVTFGTCKMVPGYWISFIFSPSKNSLRKKEISSSTQQIHSLNMMAKRNVLLTVSFRRSKLSGAGPDDKPYLWPTIFRQKSLKLLYINCTCWGHTNRVQPRHNWNKWACSGVWHIWSYSTTATTHLLPTAWVQ